MKMRDRIQRTSDVLYAAWNAHDPGAVSAVYAEESKFFDVVSGVTTNGRDSIRAVAGDCFAGFPDFSVARQTLLVEGSAGADTWIMRGTQTGRYQGLPASGNAIEVEGATFFDYDDCGLIICSTHYVDVPAYLRQLGLD